MADIYGSHFEFAGLSSRRYNLIIANLDTSRYIQSAGTISSNVVFSKKENKNYLISSNYTDSPVSFDIEILVDNDKPLTPGACREVIKWLFNKQAYSRLYIDIADDPNGEMYDFVEGVQRRSYFNCRLINPEKIEWNGGVIGYKCTLESDSPYLWQDAVEVSFNISSTTQNFTVNIDSDLNDYIYPTVTIEMGQAGGDVNIMNNTDDSTRITKFTGISANANIIMKGDINYISGDYYTKFATRNFIRLLDGENIFTINGDVKTIKFEYQNRRAM